LHWPTDRDALWRVEGLEQLLHRNVQRFRGGLVVKAHRLLYHSTLGLRVIKKKNIDLEFEEVEEAFGVVDDHPPAARPRQYPVGYALGVGSGISVFRGFRV